MKKTKKRKVNIGRLLLVIVLVVLVIGLSIFGFFYISKVIKDKNYSFDKESLHINEIDYSGMKELDFDIYSKSYMLIRLNDLKVLYGKNINERFFPASLTKVLTLDSVVRNAESLDDVSYISESDYNQLIEENSSLAQIDINKTYTIRDLLYALILPSGGDAATALSNYFEIRGENLVELMNKTTRDLNLKDSHFTNTTGLHNDDLYTTLDDYCKIVIDVLLNNQAKPFLKTFEASLEDGKIMKSTLSVLSKRDDGVKVYGGKTGFTGEAGENIMVLFEKDNRSYLLVLANAEGNPYLNQPYHINDANKIIAFIEK